MIRWFYGSTNGYDVVGRIEDGTVRVLTQTEEFPRNHEDLKGCEKFLDACIDCDYSDEWDEYDVDDVMEGIEILCERLFHAH